MTALGLFAGIGVALGLRELGLTEHGIDNEPHVAATRQRLGLATTCADITTLDPHDWAGVEGLWASPPCTDWSKAGKGLGVEGPTGRLVHEPLRWVEAIRPRWVAMEQVVEAAGAFRVMARAIEALGYRATVARMSAEEWGVPQTRERVYLLAHRDRPPRLPSPTHQPYAPGVPPERPANLLGLLPWVSMAEALWWPPLWSLLPGSVSERELWAWDRPSTTIACDSRCWPPGHKVNADDRRRHADADDRYGDRAGSKAMKLSTVDGCRLMDFPDPEEVAAALPAKAGAAWQIIGNAVCPPMAAAIVEGLAGLRTSRPDAPPAPGGTARTTPPPSAGVDGPPRTSRTAGSPAAPSADHLTPDLFDPGHDVVDVVGQDLGVLLGGQERFVGGDHAGVGSAGVVVAGGGFVGGDQVGGGAHGSFFPLSLPSLNHKPMGCQPQNPEVAP